MNDVDTERKELFYKGLIKIPLALLCFFVLMSMSAITNGFPSMFLSIASFFAFVILFMQGFGDLIKSSSLKKKIQDNIDPIKTGGNQLYASDKNLNSDIIAVATLSTLIALIITAIVPFGSISFSLGREVQLIVTAIAGPVSYFIFKEKRGAGRFFIMHFMSTMVLGRVFEVLVVVILISVYGF